MKDSQRQGELEAPAAEHLPSKFEALSSNPRTASPLKNKSPLKPQSYSNNIQKTFLGLIF
jgi:hypothetical protein